MSKIQELLNEIVESFTFELAPLKAQLERVKQKEKDAEEKKQKKIEEDSKLKDAAIDEASKLMRQSVKALLKDINKPYEIYKESVMEIGKSYNEFVNKIIRNHVEASQKAQNDYHREINIARELQKELNKALEEKHESIQRHIAEKYPEQIVEAVKLAREKGCDPNPLYQGEGEHEGLSLLYLIASNKLFQSVTAEILSYFGPGNIKRVSGEESELMAAIKARNIEAINWLLENDPDLNYQKASGSTALHMSCMMKDYDTTKCLLEKGANPNVVNTYGCTPLFDVIIRVNEDAFSEEIMIDFLRLFKNYKADFNLKNHQGQTIFEQYLAPNTPFSKIDINYNKAALEILKLSQNIEINLIKGYIGKFFMNIDNLKELITQDIEIQGKITIFCGLQKALVQFMNEQIYLQDGLLNTLDYVEDHNTYSSIAKNSLTSVKIKMKARENGNLTQSMDYNLLLKVRQLLQHNSSTIVCTVLFKKQQAMKYFIKW